MNIKLSVKGKEICLSGEAELTDLLKGLEFAMGGGRGAQTFGCVTAAGESASSGNRASGATGSHHFSGFNGLAERVKRRLGMSSVESTQGADLDPEQLAKF